MGEERAVLLAIGRVPVVHNVLLSMISNVWSYSQVVDYEGKGEEVWKSEKPLKPGNGEIL